MGNGEWAMVNGQWRMVNNQNHFAIINHSPKIGKLNIDYFPWTIVRIFTSNGISRLFWFGTAGVGILKMAQQIFKKKQKQRRCSYAARRLWRRRQ